MLHRVAAGFIADTTSRRLPEGDNFAPQQRLVDPFEDTRLDIPFLDVNAAAKKSPKMPVQFQPIAPRLRIRRKQAG